MFEKIEKIAECLKARGDEKNARSLKDVATEYVDVNEAFELGMALQKFYAECVYLEEVMRLEAQVSVADFNKVITFVKENIKQARY